MHEDRNVPSLAGVIFDIEFIHSFLVKTLPVFRSGKENL